MFAVDLIKAHRVGNHLDQATVWSCGEDLVRVKPYIDFLELENLVDLAD